MRRTLYQDLAPPWHKRCTFPADKGNTTYATKIWSQSFEERRSSNAQNEAWQASIRQIAASSKESETGYRDWPVGGPANGRQSTTKKNLTLSSSQNLRYRAQEIQQFSKRVFFKVAHPHPIHFKVAFHIKAANHIRALAVAPDDGFALNVCGRRGEKSTRLPEDPWA